MVEISPETVIARRLGPVFAWLAGDRDATSADREYWNVRDELIHEPLGDGSSFMSNIDTAMDAFNADPDRNPYQIDEDQLRAEVEAALLGLRSLGLLDRGD